MDRLDSAWSHARDILRQRLQQPPAAEEMVTVPAAEDPRRRLTPSEQDRLPAMSRCVSCGLCALVVRRVGHVPPSDLGSAYLRDDTLLPAAVSDVGGDQTPPHVLAAAAAVCPVGVPLDEVAAAVRRLAGA